MSSAQIGELIGMNIIVRFLTRSDRSCLLSNANHGNQFVSITQVRSATMGQDIGFDDIF